MGFSLNPLHDISSVLHTGETVAEDGAKGFTGALEDAKNAVTHMSPSEIGHTVLNVAGMIPVIGAPADAVNAGWYAAQGDWANAALSAATAIPGVGDFVGGARLGATGLKMVEDGVRVERAIKDGKEVASTARNAEHALNWEREATDGLSSTQSNVKAVTLQANKASGDAWEREATAKLADTQTDIRTQITIKSNGPSGLRTRMDAVGQGESKIKLSEFKASEKAPLTGNQKVVHPELEKYGGTVVGKGKAPYVGGTKIPPTHVDVIRKPTP
jgi:filamentous hemagglutinin